MHISDGVLPTSVWCGAAAVSVGVAAVLLSRPDGDRIPRIALCTSFFFVASLVHVPIGPTSVHLLLIGLVGIIIGRLAFLPILFGLILQALLFQHGGLTTIGVNALIMGVPAYAAWALFRLERRFSFTSSAFVFGFLAGGVAVVLAGLMLAGFLVAAGESFRAVAILAAAAHAPVAVAEGAITGFAALFLKRVEPKILELDYA